MIEKTLNSDIIKIKMSNKRKKCCLNGDGIMSYSATQLAKKLDISRSYLYYLKNNGVIELEMNENGRVIWSEEVYQEHQK